MKVMTRTIQLRPLPTRDGCLTLGAMSTGVTPYTTLPQLKQAESTLSSTGNIRSWQRGHGGRLALARTMFETSRGSLRGCTVQHPRRPCRTKHYDEIASPR